MVRALCCCVDWTGGECKGLSGRKGTRSLQTEPKTPKEELGRIGFQYYLITYLLTPWSRVLLEKLTGFQLVKKFSAFYGTRWFITAFINVRQLSQSWANSIQSTSPHPTSWRSIFILSSHLRLGLPSGLFHSGFFTKTLYTPLPHTFYMHRPSHSYRFYHPNNIGWGVQIIKLLFM